MREDSDNMFYFIWKRCQEVNFFFCFRLPIAFKNSRKPKLFGKGEGDF